MDIQFCRERVLSGLISCFLLMVFASQSHATEATGAIGSRIEHTDNVRRTNTNAETDVIQTTYAELGVEEVRKRFKADATLKLQNEHYYEGTYEDETSLTSGFGLFTVDLVEDFLEWQATFSRTDVVSDTSQDENPDTREFRNIFRTGPTINYAVSRLTNILLRGNYVRVDNSEDDADDNQRAEGSASVSHQINRLTSVSLNTRYSEVLESDSDEEISNGSVSLALSRAYVDGLLKIDIGQQEVESDDGTVAESETGGFVDVQLTRQAFLGHNFDLKYNHSISDTSIGFEDDETGNRLDIDPVQATTTTDIETRSRFNFNASRDADAFTYDIGLIYEESHFKLQDFTERYRGALIGFSPKLYSRLIPRFEYEYARESFGLIKGLGVDTTHTITASLKYQLVEELYADSFVTYETRTNDTVEPREFDELSVGVGLRWEFL